MFFFTYKKTRSILSTFLLVTVLASSFAFAPISHKGKVQTVHAQRAVVEVGPSLGAQQANVVLNTVTSVAQNAFYIKEFTLDGIAAGLAKLVLKSITQSILTWINSGFQGSPAFVTDLKQFLLDRADQVVGDFIYGSELGFLCSPFQLDVKIALATAYQEQAHEGFGSQSQCTLSDVTDNMEGFLNGSFNEGGYASLFEVTQNTINTPMGAYLAAEGEMYARIVDEEGRTVKELDWGSGFLSFKVCSDTQKASGAQQNCTITTPGKVIEDALTVNLKSGTQALIEADEINEIIGALFAQLAKQAITGVNGLLGLGGGSQYSSNSFGDGSDQSFLDALNEEDTISENIKNPFIEAINLEDEQVLLQEQIVAIINGVEGRLQSAIQTHGSCIGLTMPPELVSIRSEALVQILNSASAVETLILLNDVYLNSTDPNEQIEAIETYQEMLADGFIMNEVTISQLKFFIEYELADDISAFTTQISDEVRRCETQGVS